MFFSCPTPTMPHPTPSTPRIGRGRGGGGGARGGGGGGGGIGGGGYEKNIVYISIHTHMWVPRLRWEQQIGNPQIPSQIQPFWEILPAN